MSSRSTEEGGRLEVRADPISDEPGAVWHGPDSPKHAVVTVGREGMANEDVCLGTLGEMRGDLCERAWKKGVVGIEIGVDVAGGVGKAAIEPVGRPPVPLVDAHIDRVAVGIDDVAAAVARPRIAYDILDADALLPDDRIDRAREEFRLVQGNRHDGKERACLRRMRIFHRSR